MNNMHEEATDATFDTISLSDLLIYSDPSSSSREDEDDPGSSFSSFRFKVAGTLIPLPENDPKPSRKKTFPVQDGVGKVVKLAPVVRRRRRRSGRGFLMFGMGGSARMEGFDLRRIKGCASPSSVVPVSGGGGEEVAARRKSGSWFGKLVGACIPTV